MWCVGVWVCGCVGVWVCGCGWVGGREGGTGDEAMEVAAALMGKYNGNSDSQLYSSIDLQC